MRTLKSRHLWYLRTFCAQVCLIERTPTPLAGIGGVTGALIKAIEPIVFLANPHN